jgi:hypothetical protein
MRDWLLLLAPVIVVVYFLVFPGQFDAFMSWAQHLIG